MQGALTKPDRVENFIRISGYTRTDISLTTTAAQSAALDTGIYDVRSSVDTFIKVATTANDVTAANGYPLPANTTIPVHIAPNEKIGAILASGTGTLSYHRIG